MLITNTQADELFSTLSRLSGLEEQLSATCGGLIRSQRYDEAVSRAFVVLEERLRDMLNISGGAGVNLSEKAFAPDKGDLIDRLMRPRSEVDGIRNLFVGAFKAYRNRAAHTMADYTLDEARAIIHLVNLLLLILEQVREAPAHSIRKDVAELLEPESRRRLRSFLGSLEDIGIRKGEGKSKTPYQATLEYHPPSWEVSAAHTVTMFYLTASKGEPKLTFRSISLAHVVGLDIDSLEQTLLQLGATRVRAKTTPIRLNLNRYNDQETFDRLFGILRDLMDRHHVSHVASFTDASPASRREPPVQATSETVEAASRQTAARSSKYDPLRLFLEKTPPDVEERMLSFRQVESVLGFELPASAHRHRAWWSNPSSPSHHSHAQAWLAAGWEVDTVDQQEEWVRFRRAG
jgi:uncharacterized protein (TIGR02391 family)